jgi:hypothetical protein
VPRRAHASAKSLVGTAVFCFSSNVSYSKCLCQHCGGHIEFPTEGSGQTIACPHCQWNTTLTISQAPRIEVGVGAKAQKRIFLIFGLAAALVAAAGIAVLHSLKPETDRTQSTAQNGAAVTAPVAAMPAPPSKPLPPPDPWHGLQAGKVSLEKAGDGRLIHAIGTLRNASTRQRFGVKVELDVLDEDGERLGSATDYAQVIEPGKEWKFKALVTERKAAAAKLVNITEQN